MMAAAEHGGEQLLGMGELFTELAPLPRLPTPHTTELQYQAAMLEQLHGLRKDLRAMYVDRQLVQSEDIAAHIGADLPAWEHLREPEQPEPGEYEVELREPEQPKAEDSETALREPEQLRRDFNKSSSKRRRSGR